MPPQPNETGRATLALWLLSLIWGYNWIMMKVGLAYAGPFGFSALRFTLAAGCLLPFILYTRSPLWPRPDQWWPLLVLGTALTANFGLTMSALELSGTGRIAVLVYTMPFWVLLFARLALRERLSRLQVAAVAIAAGGLTVLVAPWTLGTSALTGLMAVCAGASWGASVVFVKWIQRSRSIGTLMITFWQMAIAAPLLAIIGHAFDPLPVTWVPALAGTLAYVGILGTGVAWILFYYALRRTSAGMAGLGTLSTPVIGALAAWLHLGERPSATDLGGMLLIVTALALLALPARRH